MKKSFTYDVMFFLLLLFGQLHAQVWEPVGTATGISTGPSGRLKLVSDFQNQLVVGYFDIDAMKGTVQKFDGTDWSYVGGSPGITPSYTTYNSTSTDHSGVIYFTNQAAYPDAGMEVRKFENSIWTQLPNVTSEEINFNTSAVSQDNVLFAASSENSGTVKKLVNGVWQQLGASGFSEGVPYFLNMVIGTNGKVYVSFNDNDKIHVYQNDLSAGTTTAWQPVGGSGDLDNASNSDDYNSSLTIDSNNNLYVAYVSDFDGGNKLNVRKFDGNSWTQLGPKNFSSYRTKHTSIAIGANNIVYVAFSKWEDDDTLRNTVMAYDPATNSWAQSGTGFISEGQGLYNSFAVDGSGNLFLAFADSGLNKLSVKKLNLNAVAAVSIEIHTVNNLPAEITQDNGSLQLQATVFPQTASQNVIWSIFQGETFATINSSGLLTAIASDAVVSVKATSAENGSIFKTFPVTIKNQNSDTDAQTVTVTTQNGGLPDILAIGNTLKLIATVSPAEADQKVNWSVQQGAAFASISSEGLVTGLAEGTAVIRATHLDGTVYDEIRVGVFKSGCSQGNEISSSEFGFSISKDQIKGGDDFIVAEGTLFTVSKLRFSIISTNADELSFDIDFLKDDQGIPGTVITHLPNVQVAAVKIVKDLGFGQYRYEVEVDLPQPVAFDQGTYWLSPAAIAQEPIYWELTPEGGIGSSYHFDDYDGNGWRKFSGGGFNASFEITGNCTPMPIVISTVNTEDTSIYIGESLPLKATINAQGISKNVTWSVESGTSSASVNAGGVVTGLAAGLATVKATSIDNQNLFATLDVTVLDQDACTREAVSNNFENAFLFGGGNAQRLAVDFEVQGSSFTIDSVEPTVGNFATSFSFIFYKDQNGLPGAEVTRSNAHIIHDVVTGNEFDLYFHRYKVELDNQVTLPTGKYWMEIQTDAIAWEATSADVQGDYATYLNSDTNEWGYLGGGEFVYKINGICETLGTDETDKNANLTYYPNPVKDLLTITSDEKLVNVVIYNMVGQKIVENKLNDSTVKVEVGNLTSGTYVVEAFTSGGKVKRFKIIKK